jgi:cyclopropane fatty-acyl-phospholipid synthase-like methyltransferase
MSQDGTVNPESVNLWSNADHAADYLARRSSFPWRDTAYEHQMEWLPAAPRRVLDLGCGDGLVAGRVLDARPGVEVVACDFSAEMLTRACERFAAISRVTVVEHDLDEPLPADWGRFDAVVSAFAIHHVVDERKRTLFAEVLERLEPGGVFCNLEHVASPTRELHEAFLAAVGTAPEDDDPSNKLASVEAQLAWLRDLGFEHVDCHYKWREIALLSGTKPR